MKASAYKNVFFISATHHSATVRLTTNEGFSERDQPA
jgi:hypothetical protein